MITINNKNGELNTGISIVIPAYNEEDGLRNVLEGLFQTMQKSGLSYEIIVVDDGSTDNTAILAKSFPAKLLSHSTNRGYGAAIKTGIFNAQYQLICITDADGTYPNHRIPDLAKCLINGCFDMVVGSRTGDKVSIPGIRKPAKWVINKLANFSINYKIPDINSGLRIFDKEVALNFINLLPDGFSLTTTITLAMLSNNYSVKYIPINYFPRDGRSKIHPIRDTFNFVQLITKIALYFAPLRVFLPLSIIIFLTGIFWALFSYFVLGKLADVSTLLLIMASLQLGAIGLIAELVNHRVPNNYRKPPGPFK